MAHVGYGLWRTLERTPPHVSKAFSFVEYETLSTCPNRIRPENVAPSPWSTWRNLEHIKAVSCFFFPLYLLHFEISSLTSLLPSALGGMGLSLSYGIEIKQTDDPFVELAETAIKSLSEAATFGAFLVDFIPILRYVPEYVPGAGFQKKARAWRKLQEDFRNRPYLASIEAIVCCLCEFR